MRRSLVALVSAAAIAATSLVTATSASAVPNPVPPTMFGMHVIDIAQGADPGVSYGTLRLWDAGVAWGQVEQKKGQYWWNGLDAAISNANNQRVSTLYVLGGTPTWAATNKNQGKYPNKGAASMPSMSAWKSWVNAVTQRYGASIDAYQIWNEANLSDFFQGTPKQMAQLTREAAKIIQRNDPSATIVAASSTVRLEKAYQKFFPAYMKELRKMGWPIDALSFHTYPDGKGTPATRADYIELTLADMRKAKVPSRIQLWDTEINYGIKGPGNIKGKSIVGETAAAWVAQTYLQNIKYGIDRAYWYYWYRPDGRLGIVMQDGQPGAIGYQTVNNWLTGSYYSCSEQGALNVCQLGDNDNPEVVVWADKGSATYTVPANATVQCNALNACSAVAPGTPVNVGSMPLWFGTDAKNSANQ